MNQYDPSTGADEIAPRLPNETSAARASVNLVAQCQVDRPFKPLGKMAIIESLAQVSLFSQLSQDELVALASRAVVKSYPKNVIIVSEGDQTASLFLMLSGRVKVYASNENGREVLLNSFGPNEYFGELSLIDGEPRSASIMTVAPTKVVMISRGDLIEHIHSNPGAAVSLLQVLGKKVREQTRSTKNLALLGVYERMVEVMQELGTQRDGQLVVDGVSHRHLAELVTASREMVTSVLSELKRGGYIETDRKRIVIKKTLPKRW